MSEVVTIGEPLALFAAEGIEEMDKEIKDVEHFKRFLAGAEVNVCVGLSRLGHSSEYITKLGEDPFGMFIKEGLDKENIGTKYISHTDKFFTGFELKSEVSNGDPKTFYFRRNSAAANYKMKKKR